ncbi:ATP-dependent DNA helicase RecG [Candidatus Persebacteraceae bacterium Df01]|uniref:Probable DNA 3'-5' helicase RecG n=1 Tax=Candidatus Doriopsillibacter californiensis TaxID=2970740 RepID=A0ABT7QK99_9GAMM|nr:ATP-dependent DNA helicase RecG [Candidatus Persebacteraceae bacterium Df01]
MQSLHNAGIFRPIDMLLHFPLRYEDWQTPLPIAHLRNGETALVAGEITDARELGRRGGRRQLLVVLCDEAGDLLTLRFFHVTPALSRSMTVGRQLRVRGAPRRTAGWEMAHPQIQSAAATAGIMSMYPALGKLSQPLLRQLVPQALAATEWRETVPTAWRNFTGGEWTTKDAFAVIHQPSPKDVTSIQKREHPVWQRLRFDELLAHQIILRAQYRRNRCRRAPALKPPSEWDAPLREALPFTLTSAQQKAISEVCDDIFQERPMRRLLQGDVGSGKTVVAAFACLAAAKSGFTAVLLAPTEILAVQHYTTLSSLFATAGVQCELLTGAVRGKKRREAMSRLRFGLSQVAVGTHALFQEDTNIERLGVLIIDEQHRFGVAQRSAIAVRQSGALHQLMMSATPIPRTLAMSIFADMDISVLDEKPAGRRPVSTYLTNRGRRHEVLVRVAQQVKNGGGVYWVCPLIVESEVSDLQDVSTWLEEVRDRHPELCPEILHGRMKAEEKLAVIERFRQGETRMLIATTVIEVGVDVPQADIMVIDHAERMGLSQLHQLRGRVGRGGQDGVCMLLYAEELSDTALARLKILRATDDGFKIAQKDLLLRGPGEWLGTRQSGLPALRVARLNEDLKLIAAAGKAATWMLEHDRNGCAHHVRRWLGGRRKTAP